MIISLFSQTHSVFHRSIYASIFRSPSLSQGKHRETDNFVSPITLTCTPLDCGRKPEALNPPVGYWCYFFIHQIDNHTDYTHIKCVYTSLNSTNRWNS